MGYHREPWVSGAARAAPDAWSPPAHLVLMVAHQRAPQRGLLDCLAQRGLRCIWVDGLDEVDRVADQVVPDAIVYDAQADGVPLPAALSQLRRWFAGSLLVLDGSHGDVDEIVALELGADGLLAHPVNPRLLRARLETLLRRRTGGEPPAAAGDAEPELPAGWHLDAVHNRLQRGAQSVALSGGLAHLLRCLALHAGRVVPRAELHGQVCAPQSDLRARSIDVYVHRLRQRLQAAGVHDLAIDAVRGRGFVLRSAAPGAAAPPHTARPTAGAYLNA
ncbi:MAG TPA: response regulator transcription factor [Burkholderiaceae bacterium]|nr:response regulator transcription factor [Burkholderiaceae bacterium]